MWVVKNKDDAMSFFLQNSSGKVICEKEDGERKTCGSYPEAARFFDENKEK